MQRFVLPVSLRVHAPVAETFGAWTDPSRAALWQCDRVEGSWRAGSIVTWVYGSHRQDIRVTSVEKDRLIEFIYIPYGNQPEARVSLEFLDLNGETGLRLRESACDLTLEGAAILADHACGWENMFCRLKVHLELGATFDVARGRFEAGR